MVYEVWQNTDTMAKSQVKVMGLLLLFLGTQPPI